MGSQKLALVALVLVVTAGLVLLWFAARGPSEPERVAEAAEPEIAAEDPAGEAGESARPGGARPRPELEELEEEVAEEGAAYRPHVRSDGTAVRDHRAQAGRPSGKEGTIHVPREIARVDSALVLGVRRQMRPIVKRCTDQYPGDLGEKPRLQGELAVSVSGEELEVVDATIQLFDVAGGQIDVCVHNEVLAIELPAPGHREVGRHVPTFPFHLSD